MKQRIVVLGSNSFSGAHFADYSLQQGDEVVGISRSIEPSPAFLPYRWRENSDFRFFPMDLNTDLDAIMNLIDDFKPEYVVNFAAQSMVGESWIHPEHWFQTNVVATVRFHDRLRHCDSLKRYVHISTPEVYGSREGRIKENMNCNPTTPYAVSRAAADMSLMTFFRTHHFPVVFTRASNVYGPGQQLYRIIPRAIFFILSGRRLPLHGGGRSLRSFIHIRDVALGTYLVMKEGTVGDIYHLSTDRIDSVRSLVELITSRMGVSFAEAVEETGERLGKDQSYQLDSSKAREELGWKDSVGLEDGIEDTIGWVKENMDVLKNQNSEYVHKP